MSDGLPEPLRARFVERCRSDLAALERGPQGMELRRLTHSLAGAGGMFGHPDVSEAAGAIDDALAAAAAPDPADVEALIEALRRVVRSAG